ncbi:protein kinase family protein, partial [Streptomyces sp. NPDC001274]
MAERSTAAVDVADNSGDEPLAAKADETTADGTTEAQDTAGAKPQDTDGERVGSETSLDAPDLHSGHKLAKRYRLEECVTRLDGFSSWRAVDEKLRRAVGVHLLPADHSRARSVLAAARSAALLGDPRFVQVLDAVEEDDLVYVVHEWLPDATELTSLLAAGPMDAHDAYQLVSQVSQAMAAAHREGLSHLRLTPGAVLRSSTGQYRIRGLAVNAALRGITAERPQRTDTEAIGALLYAALTHRWPYENDAYGMAGLPKGVGLLAPDQVRAGVHRGLSELAMRALANDGATASRQEQPCTTPDELAKAVAAMPRIRPPEPVFTAPPEYQRTAYQQGTYGRPQTGPAAAPAPVTVPPPPLQSRSGKVLKWAVSALLIAALGLGSWQLAETLISRIKGSGADETTQTPPKDG